MSLLPNQRNWMTFGGEPVQGLTPTSVRLRAGTLTPERRAGAQAAYNKFCTAKSLSLAGGGYFTGDELLPDGTRVRMVSINGVDHVHIWAADPAPEETLDITFWCQPFDEEWLTEQYEEVFTIPRWFSINDTDADDSNDSADFLRDLVRNTAYEPPASTNYPGNLTWFAPGTGLVVSWWGQMRRYSNSALDRTIDEAKSWLRPTDPRTTYLTAPPYGPRVGPTGGVAGALAGQMFHQDGVTTLPVGVPATPLTVPHPPKSSSLWVNGKRTSLPGGSLVESACRGFRSGKPTLRATSYASGLLKVWEQETVNYTWVQIGAIGISAVDLGIHHPDVVKVGPLAPVNIGPGWNANAELEHPFYWNADGNKAVGLLRFIRNSSISVSAGIVHAVVELTVGASSCSLALIDYSHNVNTSDLESVDTGITGPSSGSYAGTHNATVDTTDEYVGVLAADYRGNELIVLRTHISETLNRTEAWEQDVTAVTSYFSFTDALGPATIFYTTTTNDSSSSISQTSTLSTWVSRNGVPYAATVENRISTLVASTTRHEFQTGHFEPDPDYAGGTSTVREYRAVYDGNAISGGEDSLYSASGPASLWGVTAGDLRGEFYLHSQPLFGTSDVQESDRDSNYTYSQSYTYPASGGGGSSANASFSKTLRTDLGRLMHVDTSESFSEVTKLIHPQRLEKLGTGTQTWSDGTLDTSSRAGPYGAGPVWTDFGMPSTGYSLGTASLTQVRETNYTRNYMRWSYPDAAPSTISPSSTVPIINYVGGGASGPGAFANTVLVGCAMTPDARVQYTGALLVAMCPPTAPTAPICYQIDRWTVDGTAFTPAYPDQPDPDNPGDMLPFPHRGGHAVLLKPIFTGPLP